MKVIPRAKNRKKISVKKKSSTKKKVNKRGKIIVKYKKPSKPSKMRSGMIKTPEVLIDEDKMTPGQKGVLRGKMYEVRVIKNDLRRWFKCLIVENRYFIESLLPLVKEKLVVVYQYSSTYKIDLLLINPRNKKKLAIEVRYYSGGKTGRGSLEERIEAWYAKAEDSKIPSIMIRGGGGWSDSYIERATRSIRKFNRRYVLDVFNRETERDEIRKFIKRFLGIR